MIHSFYFHSNNSAILLSSGFLTPITREYKKDKYIKLAIAIVLAGLGYYLNKRPCMKKLKEVLFNLPMICCEGNCGIKFAIVDKSSTNADYAPRNE